MLRGLGEVRDLADEHVTEDGGEIDKAGSLQRVSPSQYMLCAGVVTRCTFGEVFRWPQSLQMWKYGGVCDGSGNV